MKTARYVVGVCALLGLTGCPHRIPDVTDDVASKPEKLVAPPDKALVVFVRPSAWPMVYPTLIDEKGTFLGNLTGAAYLAVPVEPGQHDFMIFIRGIDVVRAQVAKGKVYVIEAYGVPGFSSANFYFSTVVKGGEKWPYPRSELKDLRCVGVKDPSEAQQVVDEYWKADKLQEGKDSFAELKGDDLRKHTLSPDDGMDAL